MQSIDDEVGKTVEIHDFQAKSMPRSPMISRGPVKPVLGFFQNSKAWPASTRLHYGALYSHILQRVPHSDRGAFYSVKAKETH